MAFLPEVVPGYKPPVYKLSYTTPYEVVSPGLHKRKFTVSIVCQLSCNANGYKEKKTKRN